MTQQQKILITGGTGQVGFELQRSLLLHGNILAPSRSELNLAEEESVTAYLAKHQPDLIINAAAYTAVDKAESEVETAQRLNAELPAQLAAWCKSQNKPLIHYSSDYVYPGTGTQAWQENSPTGPVNTYGHTKLEGDQAIINSGCQHLIFRTSWVYSARGHNFMKTMLKLGQDKEALKIVNDQIGAPTPARLIAEVTALAVERQLPSGVYHLAPRGETSWQGFAQAIFAQAKQASLALKIQQVEGIPTTDYPTPAARPLNSRLSLDKLEQALNTQLPTWENTLKLTLKEYL